MNQAELITYLNDPQTIARAAEGSMTRRNALLDRAELVVALNKYGRTVYLYTDSAQHDTIINEARDEAVQRIQSGLLDTLLELQALAIAYEVRDEDRLVNVQDYLKRRIAELVRT